MKPLDSWKKRASELKLQTYAVYLAYKDPRVPWHARVFAACVVGYAFSPIDLIPDPIPVLGYLDDLVLLPLGVAMALRMIPQEVMAECRQKAEAAMREGKPTNWKAAAAIITVWVILTLLVVVVMVRTLKS
ncbi:MAG: YkvA family protein [Anaerolineae bacterium]|nr:YkvA family protein [Anaerolineae bacterium]